MKTVRRNTGAMLALVCAFIAIFVVFGIGIFYMVKVFGGQKQLQNAVDSGTINVAKTAMTGVYAPLSTGVSPVSFFDCTLTPMAGHDANGNPALNVYQFNRALGQAVVVGLNAQDMLVDAKNNTGANSVPAVGNINALITRLTGGPNSLGGQLRQSLMSGKSGNSNWAQDSFNKMASANPLSMLGVSTGPQWDASAYKASYYSGSEETCSSAPAAILTDASWGGYLHSSLMGGSVTSGFLTGYGKGISMAGINNSQPMFGVSCEPAQAPHLISVSALSDPKKTWAPPSGVFVPPNSFKCAANTKDSRSNLPTNASAAAVIGALPAIQNFKNISGALSSIAPAFTHILAHLDCPPAYAGNADSPMGSTISAGIPGGYIIIDNSNSSTPNQVSGNPSSTHNVFSDELGVGITVDDTTLMFSNNGAVQSWQAFAHTPPAAGKDWDPKSDPLVTASSKIPSVAGLYNKDGSAAKLAQAGAIPFSNNGANPTPTSLCTDQNSDTVDPSSDPDCVKLASPPHGGGLDPFDVAYHPNAGAKQTVVAPSPAQLTAAEVAKVELEALWGPSWSMPNHEEHLNLTGIHPTGLRLWPGNQTPDRQNYPEWPYGFPGFGFNQCVVGTQWSDPSIPGRISHPGTVYQLYHQIEPDDAGYRKMLDAVTTRVAEMGPVGNPPAQLGTFGAPWIICSRPRRLTPDLSTICI